MFAVGLTRTFFRSEKTWTVLYDFWFSNFDQSFSTALLYEKKIFTLVKSKGKIIHFIQTKVDISKDSIYVNGNRISKKLPPKLYFAVNKPKGLVSYFPCFSCVLHRCHDYLAFQWNICQRKGTINLCVVSICYRYICSCGEESKSVVSLFNDYLKGWVCSIAGLGITSIFYR